jgi:hypothetical protein
MGRYMAQAVSRRPWTTEARIQSQDILYEAFGEKVALGQALHWLRFSPVSIIPPKPHTHSFIYNQRYLISAIAQLF